MKINSVPNWILTQSLRLVLDSEHLPNLFGVKCGVTASKIIL